MGIDIKSILDYQSSDFKYFEIETKLKNSPEAKNVMILQKYAKGASAELQRLDGQAESLITQLGDAERALAAAETEYKEFSDEPTDGTVKAFDFYIKALDKLGKTVDALGREIKGILSRVETVKKQSDNDSKVLREANAKSAKSMELFLQLKTELTKEAAVYKAEMAAKEKKIDPKLMERYKKVRAEKGRLPVVAELNGSVCVACGMDLSADMLSKFTADKQLHECPNCGVLIYKG